MLITENLQIATIPTPRIFVSPYSNNQYSPYKEMAKTIHNIQEKKCVFSPKLEKFLELREYNKTEMR